MTNSEIKQLAVDVYSSKVFTSRQIAEGEAAHLLGMIFMPLLFMDAEQHKELDNTAFIYEYYDKASPRGINGYPIFMSLRMFPKEHFDKFLKYYKKVEKALKAV
jgi:hypothetical protein